MSTKHLLAGILIVVIVCVQACQRTTPTNQSPQQQTSSNVFEGYLATDIPPADGFDFPVGDANATGLYKDIATGIEYQGWRIATHFAENYELGIHTGEGIGFHGWIKEWDNSGPRHLSWGCVVMHLYDTQKLYDQIPEGTMVVIR